MYPHAIAEEHRAVNRIEKPLPAVREHRVIVGVAPNHHLTRAFRRRQSAGMREENEVSAGDHHGVRIQPARATSQGRAARGNRGQGEALPTDAVVLGDRYGGVEFAGVHLAVAEGKGDHLGGSELGNLQRQGNGGIDSAGEQDDGFHSSNSPCDIPP